MRRRDFLGSTIAGGTLFALGPAQSFAASRAINWTLLRRAIGARLIPVHSPMVQARKGQTNAADLFRRLRNPYWIGDEPGLTQTLGWIDAWTSQPSLMAVEADRPSDVAAAVRFAAANRVPLIVKGGGHSYFGNSNRSGSLLVWTRRLRGIEVHEQFQPQGSPAGTAEPARQLYTLVSRYGKRLRTGR